MQNIATGDKITVKVVQQPSNAAARKTIVRLLSKDHDVKAENRRIEKSRTRHTKQKQRGGRMWTVRLVKQRPVKGDVGESGTIMASADVIRDLGSVERFVEVGKA